MQPQPPTITKSKRSMHLHLITDDGFGRRVAINLLIMSVIIAVIIVNQSLYNIALDVYYEIKEFMMQIANKMAWWSLLGLLSSSCCAIQILLNASSFGFGCAGFNNVLGTARPTFLALTIIAQLSNWYVLLTYSITYQQWRMTTASTLLSVSLTLLPEIIAWQTARRERTRQQQSIRTEEWIDPALNNSDDTTKSNNTTLCGAITLQFQLSTMGCSSCVSTVSKVLDSINGVLRHTVNLENGIAKIVLDEAIVLRHFKLSITESSVHNVLWKNVARRLEEAGFPADIPDSKKER